MTIEFHTWNTPNGRKISVALEEMGLPYKVFPVNISKGEQMAPDFLSLSPNNKIPAIVDPEGPDGKRVSVFESGAILLYLGEKTGKFLPVPLVERISVYEWLMWQIGGVGPMPGQGECCSIRDAGCRTEFSPPPPRSGAQLRCRARRLSPQAGEVSKLRPHARFASNAIFTASPASTVPISQRCTNSQVGRVPRNSAIDPAASAIMALTLTLMTIWIEPSASDCVSTLPIAGSMNCGNRARYSIAIF